MKLLDRINLTAPIFKMSQTCERCGQGFACEIGLKGCWCSGLKLSKEILQQLKATYKKCLCRACLEEIKSQ